MPILEEHPTVKTVLAKADSQRPGAARRLRFFMNRSRCIYIDMLGEKESRSTGMNGLPTERRCPCLRKNASW